MFKRYATITTVMAGLIALFAPTAQGAPKDDCSRVPSVDRPLCRSVRAQHAYGWVNADGSTVEIPSGRLIVRDVTHSGLSAAEVRAALRAEAASYRAHVTAVAVNLDTLRSSDCWFEVGYVDADGKPGGVKLTKVEQLCP